MVKKILIDSEHKEETRIAVINNNQICDYDFKVSSKEEVKGNIYLAKVIKIEPSLQAAFVDYGRNKQGFLSFNEIGIDCFNLPDNIKAQLKSQEAEIRAQRHDRNIKQNTDNEVKSNEKIDRDIIDKNNIINEAPQSKDDSIDISNSYFIDLTSKESTNTAEAVVDFNKQSGSASSAPSVDQSTSPSPYGTRMGYKIQDVVNKNDLILVQVLKDERGNKGASLTTYLSIPGRYCVLLPNSYRVSGGVSKKISNITERNRLKKILDEINKNNDSSLIIRTAGINETKENLTQDFSYISNLWESIKKQFESTDQPMLIYEEANLVKKFIRDSLSSEIAEIHINDHDTYEMATSFAKLIYPEIVHKIHFYKNNQISLFNKFKIEESVQNIFSPVVALKSGGYLVIHPTEALTSVDVNSGKFKGNKNIEETALQNNLEAAAEVAKQMRLRNIGGLIVIDFIDMENPKNRLAVQREFQDKTKNDSAKINIGEISSFGLLELARQHVKSSLFEKNFTSCSKCQGTGYNWPTELNALQILRRLDTSLNNQKTKFNSNSIVIKIPSDEAFYLLNHKRDFLNTLEERLGLGISLECDDKVAYPFYEMHEVISAKKVETSVLMLEEEIKRKQTQYRKQPESKKPEFKKSESKPNYTHQRSNSNKSHQYRNKPGKKAGPTSKKNIVSKKNVGWFKKLFG